MDIHTRIREARKAIKMSRRALALLCGVSYVTVFNWERPANDPKSYTPHRDTLPLVAKHLKVDAIYLLTGISGSVPSQRFAFIRRYIPELRDQEGNLIDFTDIERLGDPEDTFPYRSDWLHKMNLTADQCRVTELEDGAMKINGQLLIDTAATNVIDGKLYVIVTPSGTRARYLHSCANGSLILRADANPNPELVAKDTIKIAGRVVAHTNFL